jgi:hypothetical protein
VSAAPDGYIACTEAAAILGTNADAVRGWIRQTVLAGRIEGDDVWASAEDVERLRSEIYGVPDLVFDQPEDPTPPQMEIP